MCYWICLYAVESEAKLTFVYGYATQAIGKTERPFGSSKVDGTGRWKLHRYVKFLTDKELADFRKSLASEDLIIATSKGNTQIGLGGLVIRPPVYAVSAVDPYGGPSPLSDQLCRVEAHWNLNKTGLMARLFPPQTWSIPEASDAFGCVIDLLTKETGLSFIREPERLGNFEVIDYVTGSYELFNGLHVHPYPFLKGNNLIERSLAVAVRITPPLSEHGPVLVGCRLRNGTSKTLVLDQVKAWPPQDAQANLLFEAQEPFFDVEVSVWENGGNLLARKYITLIRSVHIDFTTYSTMKRISGPWAKKLPPHFKTKATILRTSQTETGVVKGNTNDPWVEAESEARNLIQSLFPPAGTGQWFATGIESHVNAMQFLRGLVSDSRTKRVILADPYLDTDAFESLLIYCSSTSDVKVVTSSRPQTGEDSEPFKIRLAKMCTTLRKHLPIKFQVIYLSNTSDNEPQFHDRLLLLDQESGIQVWMLSNSLSTSAKRFPLIITELSAKVSEHVKVYLEQLVEGNLSDRPDMQHEVAWDSLSNQAPEHLPLGPMGLETFPGWHGLLRLMVSCKLSPWQLALLRFIPEAWRRWFITTILDRRTDRDMVKAVLRQGYLCETSNGNASWHIREDLRPCVANSVDNVLNCVQLKEYLEPLAYWAYLGGPEAKDHHFDPEVSNVILTTLRDWILELENNSMESQTFEPLSDNSPLGTALPAVLALVDNPDNWHDIIMFKPLGTFLVSLLDQLDPDKVIGLISETKSFLLLCLFINDLYGGRDISYVLIPSSNGTLQALGIALLWNSVGEETERMRTVLEALRNHHIPPIDTVVSLVHLAATQKTFRAGSFGTEIADITRAWPDHPFTEAELQAFTKALTVAVGSKATILAAELSLACPIPSDANYLGHWVVGDFLARLPLKGTSPAWDAPGSERELDLLSAETIITAKQILRLQGMDAAKWFLEQVLNRLHWDAAKEPLLRSRDFARWHKLLTGLLSGLLLGVTIVDNAELEQHQELMETVGPAVTSALFLNMEREIWHYVTPHGVLAELVVAISTWTRQANVPSQVRADVERIVQDQNIPDWLRIAALLRSEQLIINHEKTLFALIGSQNLLIDLGQGAPAMAAELLASAGDKHTADHHLQEVLQFVKDKLGEFTKL